MYKKNSIKIFLIGLAISMLLGSCLNENDSNQKAYGDAFIKSKMQVDSTVSYKLELFSYSWSEMENVEVYFENESEAFKLDTFDYKYTFAYQPQEEILLPQPPEHGHYNFYVTFQNGEAMVATDYLMESYIDPPTISRLEWDDEDKTIILEWEPVENAQLYSIMLLNANNQIVFETELLDETVHEKWINQFTYGWYTNKKPTENTTYRIMINAYLFEPVYSTFDIQCIAVNDIHTIEWIIEE